MSVRGRNKGAVYVAKKPEEKTEKEKTVFKKKSGYYFYDEEEQALVDYIHAPSQEEKERIFQEKLLAPFTKMIQSIIRRYKLYVPDEGFDTIFHDTFAHLITKIPNFDPTSGYKGYSYCGTVCKNYLINRINTFTKEQKKSASYEDNALSLDDSINFSYNNIDNRDTFNSDIISETAESIKERIDTNDTLPDEDLEKLNTSDIKVGKALLNLLSNWENMMELLDNNKFNRYSVIYYIKEVTLLPVTDVNKALKKYKEVYIDTKNKLLEL